MPRLRTRLCYEVCELTFTSSTPPSSRLSLRVHHASLSESITPLSPRPSHFISLAAALAAPLVCSANHRQPALRRSNGSHASFCSPPSTLPCPNSSSPSSNSSCGITPKFHYTIELELDARGIRRAGKVSLEHIRLQANSRAWIGILRQDKIYLRA
jgi:hypothetical protein